MKAETLTAAIDAQLSRILGKPPVETMEDMAEDGLPAQAFHESNSRARLLMSAAGNPTVLNIATVLQAAFLLGFHARSAAESADELSRMFSAEESDQ